jgi:multimeric flavodoxin WrbA
MKILAINGSYRGERGYTHFLIGKIFEGARAVGAECEQVTLSRLKINHCLGCNVCQRSARPVEGQGGYSLECVYQTKDEAQAVFEKMKQADLILYATPVYVFGMSTLLKVLLERFYGTSYCETFRVTQAGLMFHHVNPEIASKPFASLVVCDNLENETPKNAVSYFRTFAKFMDAPQVGSLVRNAGALTGHGDDPEAAAKFPKITEVYAAYVQAGVELGSLGKISAATERRANQEVLPVPFFSLLKRLPLRAVKEKFVTEANKMRSNTMSN